MGAIADRMAVQTWCFRGLQTNARVAAAVREAGLSRVELSKFAEFQQPQTFDATIADYKNAGVEIISAGVFGIGRGGERGFFDFARKAGLKQVSIDFAIETMPENFKLAEQLADEYGLLLGIHNHGGGHWLGCPAAIDYVLKRTSKRIGLCLDLAWAMHSHQDPVAMVERFGERLYGIHLKDFIFDRAGRHQDVVVGTGNLDLHKLKAALQKVGFGGIAVLEYEGDVDNPLPAIKECVKSIGAVL